MEPIRNPHELLVAYVGDTLGRRREQFGEVVTDDLFGKLVLGVTDQLSAYLQCVQGARLSVGEVTLRHGRTRAYLIAPISDRKSPLRLRDAMRRWDMIGSSDIDLILDVNGRRWNFVDRYLHRVLYPLLTRIGDRVADYYRENPAAKRTVGMIRFMEDVHRTILVAEIDERDAVLLGQEKLGGAESLGRYYLQ